MEHSPELRSNASICRPQKRRAVKAQMLIGMKSPNWASSASRKKSRTITNQYGKAQPSRTAEQKAEKGAAGKPRRSPSRRSRAEGREIPAAPSHRGRSRAGRQQAPDARIEQYQQQGNRKHRTSQQASTKTYKLSTTVPLREISGADCAIQGAYCVQTVPLKRTRCYVSFVTQ